jgi:hypothetical protein
MANTAAKNDALKVDSERLDEEHKVTLNVE